MSDLDLQKMASGSESTSVCRDGLCATSRLQKAALIVAASVVAAGVVGTLVAPSAGVTRAPIAALDLKKLLSPDSMPLMTVEREDLPHLKMEPNGLTVAQMRQVLAYDLDLIKDGASVPRVFLASIPPGLGDVSETDVKKALFYKSVLPLVLQVNDEILNTRKRLLTIHAQIASNSTPAAADRLWLAMMSERYDVDRDDTTALLNKVDIVPPSLALAQAATESGWGTSRFTREGNALFGQWTFAKGNLVPSGRDDGKEHMIKRFDALIDSVRAYVRNLNTHRAYREFRDQRARLRGKGELLDGRILAGALHRYSELGVEYVNAIRAMISHNDLRRFDGARLDGESDDPSA